VNEVGGVPTHYLLVHLVVVAVPAAALVAIACALSPRVRRRWGTSALLMSVLAAISTYLAYETGHSLELALVGSEATRRHVAMGAALNAPTLVLALAVLGKVLFARLSERIKSEDDPRYRTALRTAGVVASAVTILAASTAVTTVYRIGNSGSNASWERVENGNPDAP